MTSTGIPMKRRWSYGRVLGVTSAITVATLAVTSCWETDVDDNLHIRNETSEPVAVEYVLTSGERVDLDAHISLQSESLVFPPADPDVDGEPRCTTGPIIVRQGATEIQRFDPPVCYGEGLTLTVDGVR